MSFGAQLYEGLGGGVKLTITGKGISSCFDVGGGYMADISFDPTAELDEDSLTGEITAEGSALGFEGELTSIT